MLPYVYIFGFPVPMYGLMAMLGFGVSLLIAMRWTEKYYIPKVDLGFVSVFIIIGIIVGSKLLYFLTHIPKLIKYWDVFLENPWAVLIVVFSGYVFYGGLIGAALAVYLYARHYRYSVWAFADILAPVIPLFHFFGRLGCFFGGCCYGIEYHGLFAIKFPYNELVPELCETERFPVQLMESGLNMLLFIFLVFFSKKKRKPGQSLGIYLVSYTIIRMVTEQFRGDIVRGVSNSGISTSQLISLLLLPAGVWMILRREKNSPRKTI